MKEEQPEVEWLDRSDAFSTSIPDGQDVIDGLTKTSKHLHPKYFYDDIGSELYERVCELQEYYLTRTEAWILQNYAMEIATKTGACELVELGSGNSTKIRILLDGYQALGSAVRYVPIDISGKILEDSVYQLKQDYPSLQIDGFVGTYEQALAQLNFTSFPARMVCFFGSTLGNFTIEEVNLFFANVTKILKLGDYFLVGIDLQKEREILETAYNDSQGVNSTFNLNMLSHLNWRFYGNFDLSKFKHKVIYNCLENQIELYAECQQYCTVHLAKLNLIVDLQAGECILTQISRKFTVMQMEKELQVHSLKLIQFWTDPQQWFAVLLCQMQI